MKGPSNADRGLGSFVILAFYWSWLCISWLSILLARIIFSSVPCVDFSTATFFLATVFQGRHRPMYLGYKEQERTVYWLHIQARKRSKPKP